ncbi:MAG: alanine racemase [Candidatus Omnitrophica bacterium]|nr:alanine racemase [Candidatus Omnitrophota bacterium]
MNKKIISYRPTWAEIDLKALADNLDIVRRRLNPSTKILATVKADAYGHGIVPVARKLVGCGVDYFGVASIDEAIILRKDGIKKPILVLGLILNQNIPALFKWQLIPTVCTIDFARKLNKYANSLKRKINIHIKVDTGMARLGVDYRDADELICKISCLPWLNIEGLFTHFAFADMDWEFTQHQIDLFNNLILRLSKKNIQIPLIHAANSIGLLAYRNSHFTMVRPGLVLYGLHPQGHMGLRFKPVLALKTKVIFVKRVPKGTGISYGHTYVTKQATNIVTLPIGYGDGYPRALSNKGIVLIKGKRFTISGRICMDQCMVDVGNTKVKIGEEAVLIGKQGKQSITVEELAQLAKTIPYEIVCSLGNRIPRVYLNF